MVFRQAAGKDRRQRPQIWRCVKIESGRRRGRKVPPDKMSFSQVKSYNKTDVFHGGDDAIYPKDKTLGEMIDLAIKHKSPILVKAGKNAKWYLKGSKRTTDQILTALQEKEGKSRDGVVTYYIHF